MPRIEPVFINAAQEALRDVIGRYRAMGLDLQRPSARHAPIKHEFANADWIESVDRGTFPFVMTSLTTPMSDFDLPTPHDVHKIKGAVNEEQIARERSLGEIIEGAREWSRMGETGVRPLRMSLTPGGVHIDDISYEAHEPERFFGSAPDRLRKIWDPGYEGITKRRGRYHRRVSPKFGREGDFVARPIKYFGSDPAFMNDERLTTMGLQDALINEVVDPKADEVFKETVAYHLGRKDIDSRTAAYLRRLALLSAVGGTRAALPEDSHERQNIPPGRYPGSPV